MKGIINYTIEQLRYRRALRRQFEPTRAFLRSSEKTFVAEVARRRAASFTRSIPHGALFRKIGAYAVATAGVAVLSMSGLIAYADVQNVKVSHPLYPLKRVGEQVRLATTPRERETELRKELAVRRAAELREIEDRGMSTVNAQSGDLDGLERKKKELRVELRRQIEAIEDHVEREEAGLRSAGIKPDLCLTIRASGDDIDGERSQGYRKFEQRCNALLHALPDTSSTMASDDRATSTAPAGIAGENVEQSNRKDNPSQADISDPGDRGKGRDAHRIEQE